MESFETTKNYLSGFKVAFFLLKLYFCDMSVIFLSLGTNIGDRVANLEKAHSLIEAKFKISNKSSIYETEPWGGVAQGLFLNQVLQIETSVEPRELLKMIKNMESEMGRTETAKWGPRVIDIDILFYGDLVIDEPELIIPHKFLHERKFALEPLNEIAPDFVHPVLKKKISELLSVGKRFF